MPMDYTVLIVDDNDNNRFTLKALLDSRGIASIEASTGSEALACLLKNEVHLIILDIQLPDFSGFQIAKTIKSRKKTMGIPIIFATAVFKSDEEVLKGYELGAIDYILKPINMDLFLAKINYYYTVAKERYDLLNTLEVKNQSLTESIKKLTMTQKKLKESSENWQMLGIHAPFHIEIYNRDQQLLFQNRQNNDYTLKLLHENHSKAIAEIIHNTFIQSRSLTSIVTLQWTQNQYYYEIKSIFIHENSLPRCMLIYSDITLQKKHEEDISYLGYHDQLTGLWNRHYFQDYIKRTDISALLPISIIMADVNGLKLINDGFGHNAGDELIKAAAHTLEAAIDDDAILARWGGDEFLALLPATDEQEAEKVAKAITASLDGELIANKFPVSLALGQVTCYVENFDLEALIKEAEDKMYINKMRNQTSYRSFIVESLKGALFEQDYETREHTERLSQMALMVADQLKLTETEKNKLILLGSLHDIGKIGISKALLNQETKLSNIDWKIIQKHPEIGFRICNAVPELSTISNLILSHHERWDGKGYPRTLKGTEIPILARLISILDTYDVITNDRPYQKKKSPEYAMEEIRRCSGSQFDPNLVTVFEHVYNDILHEDHLTGPIND